MNPFRQWRGIAMSRRVAEHERLLVQHADRQARDAFQLDRLNRSWAASLEFSPFARSMRALFDLPLRFKSWEAFSAQVPAMDKTALRRVLARGGDGPLPPGVQWRATGGTTAEPFRFPVSRQEAGATTVPMWHARRSLAVGPEDRLFLLWGHSHLLGRGAGGMARAWRRVLADRVSGYLRFSAYELDQAAMRRAGDAMLRFRPRWVLGYSSGLDRFARVNADRSGDFAALGLKVCVPTAEGLPFDDSRSVIAATLGAPVCMEYGAVETGPIAYEAPDPGFRAFWTHFRLEGEAGPQAGGQGLLVTCLFARALPLLRYRIGDMVEPCADGRALSEGFARVRGRSNDSVRLAGGVTIHSEAISHAVRDLPGILAYQVRVDRSLGTGRLCYEADADLPDAVCATVRDRLGRIHPSLANMPLERVARIGVSVAGKRPMVVEE